MSSIRAVDYPPELPFHLCLTCLFILNCPLDVLTLDSNNLAGAVSQSLCDRTGTEFFDLKELTVDCDVVACECCICNVNRTNESD